MFFGLKRSATRVSRAISAVRSYRDSSRITAVLCGVVHTVLNVTHYALDTLAAVAAFVLIFLLVHFLYPRFFVAYAT